MCQRAGEFHRDGAEVFVRDDAVDETERQCFVGLDRAPGKIELARFGSADQPSQKEAAAKITGKADSDKGGHQPCRSAGDGFLMSTPFQRVSRRFINEVCEGLVPALQRRGLVREAYTQPTLRQTL